MFTGLVETMGRVLEREDFEQGVRFRLSAPDLTGLLADGDSLAIDGVCHTVFDIEGAQFTFESVRTTLSRTTLGQFVPGREANLERAVRAGEPMGGHLVQGHVDGVGVVDGIEKAGETVFIRFRMPEEVARLTVLYGSIAMDGISLTVNSLFHDVAEVAIIPYTWDHTNVGRLSEGSEVNLEADLVGKYVDQLLRPYRESTA
ncbi:MAG: riboflavin synthase [Candidatus Palauibacterales bacterium]|jgi:riboflavin synthase|nr:riboflavin synthase [Candidatus Palauibacterales bacterium]